MEVANIWNYIKSLGKIFLEVWNFTIAVVDSNNITIGTLVIGGFMLFVGYNVSRILSKRVVYKLLNKVTLEKSARHTLEKLCFYSLLVIFSLFALRLANIPITIFTVLGGAFAIGVGFGSQNIVNNFISGLIILAERPIKVGDYVEVEGEFGQIEDIGMRSTVVLSPGNVHIIMPNSHFLEKKVVNWTHADPLVRGSVKVGIAYGSDTQKANEILVQVMESDPQISNIRKPYAWFQDFGDSSLVFEAFFWIKMNSIIDRPDMESKIRFKVDQAFRDAGITIAFPQQDVHLYTHKPLDFNHTHPPT